MVKLLVFRHGQSTDNAPINKCSGWANPDLTQDGIKEAQGIRDRLASQKVTKAYSSDLIRAIRTLQIVLEPHPDIPIIEDSRIKERNYGDITGRVKKELAVEFPDLYPLWHRSYDVAPPGGESIKDVEVRVNSFLDEMLKGLKKDDIVLLSIHGNSLRPMRRRFEGLTIEQMCTFEHEMGRVYEYNI